ncbi:MAG: hypothetical protein GF403_03920 [Candidatus Coatesbacteria bacterium]|nr:hypothetical protein [Candidatus Coatesbacteria bacterium]
MSPRRPDSHVFRPVPLFLMAMLCLATLCGLAASCDFFSTPPETDHPTATPTRLLDRLEYAWSAAAPADYAALLDEAAFEYRFREGDGPLPRWGYAEETAAIDALFADIGSAGLLLTLDEPADYEPPAVDARHFALAGVLYDLRLTTDEGYRREQGELLLEMRRDGAGWLLTAWATLTPPADPLFDKLRLDYHRFE